MEKTLPRLTLVLSSLFTWQAWAQPQTAPITVAVDLSDAPRKILHAQLSFPVKPGPLTLLYPQWIPGEHSPTGPIENLAGLVFTAGGKPLPWHRDEINMYAFHLKIPPGTATLIAKMDFLATAAAAGFSSGASTSANLCLLSWNTVLLYPAGVPVAQLQFQPSITLPGDWQWGTALTSASAAGSDATDQAHAFQPVSLETLVDSPVLAGRFFKEIPLASEIAPQHFLDLAGDGPEDLNVNQDDLAGFANLVREAGRLYASHHYTRYHFLVTLSDSVSHFGLEHHESSDDRVSARTFLDDDLRLTTASLLPHEFTHSWNGKFRRPAGLMTATYSEPMRASLLWIYEGLTSYLGNVLATRSGLWTRDQYRAYLAESAATLDHRPGRTWRYLGDTATAAQTLYGTGESWDNWRRSVDYYDEGELVWLEADVTIRKLSKGKRSLDDFCALFYGAGGTTPPKVVPYTLPDVVAALNQVQPYGWTSFFDSRINRTTDHAPLEGITRGGYRLAYTAEPNEFERAGDGKSRAPNFWFSLGLRMASDGVADVLVNSPAYRAGIGPGMKIVAVNGRAYTDDLLRTAVEESKSKTQPIELILENTEFFKTVRLDYDGGPRHPHLERNEESSALLDEILKPLVVKPEPKLAGVKAGNR